MVNLLKQIYKVVHFKVRTCEVRRDWRCSVKQVFFLQNPQEINCVEVSSLIKSQASGLQLY